MMTIEQYRTSQAVELPRNGEGEQMPQLIDDLYEAREALKWLRRNSKGYGPQIAAEGLGRLNRALKQLGIIELKPITK
jgi:hypothetical protein